MAVADVAERLTDTPHGARCARCFLDGKLVHTHSGGRPIDDHIDRCPGCQEPMCDRGHLIGTLGLRLSYTPHDVADHAAT